MIVQELIALSMQGLTQHFYDHQLEYNCGKCVITHKLQKRNPQGQMNDLSSTVITTTINNGTAPVHPHLDDQMMILLMLSSLSNNTLILKSVVLYFSSYL